MTALPTYGIGGGGGGNASARTGSGVVVVFTPRVLLCALLAALASLYALRGPMCKGYALHEAELHARGLWRAPRLGVDSFIARRDRSSGAFSVLLVQRDKEPFKGRWCVPGGFVLYGEDPIDAVRREIAEETHLDLDPKKPPVFVNFRGSPKRDPRAHSLSASYVTTVDAASLSKLQSDDDAGAAKWFPLDEALKLSFAFDHGDILKECAAWFEAHGKEKGLFVEA